jgi:O-antigen ligase
MIKIAKKAFLTVTVIFFLLFLIVGGFGKGIDQVSILSIVIGFILALFAFFLGKKKLTKSLVYYFIFSLFLVVSLFWSKDQGKSILATLPYLAGGLVLFVSQNQKKKLLKFIDWIVVIPGIVFGFFYFSSKFTLNLTSGPFSLFLPVSSAYNHIHIGDYWVLIGLLSIYNLISKQKNKVIYAFLIVVSAFFITISFSRSAYVALIAGIVFLFYKSSWLKKYKKLFWALTIFVAAIFFVVSTQKTTLFSRQYFVQAVLGVVDNPLGVGMGNFNIISENPEYQVYHLESFSNNPHNIILDVFVGMGVLGMSFVYFLFYSFKKILKDKDKKAILPQTLFVALTTNFMFDFTYLIPTMLYLWFILLGLGLNEKTK